MPRTTPGVNKIKIACPACGRYITDEKSSWTRHKKACYPSRPSVDPEAVAAHWQDSTDTGGGFINDGLGSVDSPIIDASPDAADIQAGHLDSSPYAQYYPPERMPAAQAGAQDSSFFLTQRPLESESSKSGADHLNARDSREPMLGDIKIVYHPNSGRADEILSFNQFQSRRGLKTKTKVHSGLRYDENGVEIPPWHPYFNTYNDFEFAELFLRLSLNHKETDDTLGIIHRASAEKSQITFQTFEDVDAALKNASKRLTPFIKETISVYYPPFREDVHFDFYYRDLWLWAEELVQDPLLADYFEWDAQRLFRFDGESWVRFIDEPYTAQRMWDIQSNLPTKNGKPFGLILYADESKLSSFGTAKAYPIVSRLANLKGVVRNGRKIGGGSVIAMLPIVEAVGRFSGQKKKKAFTTLKNHVWHKCVGVLLQCIAKHATAGWPGICGDEIFRILFAFLLILCADYKEQSIMALIRGVKGLFPCSICLIPRDQISTATAPFTPRTLETMLKVISDARKLNKTEGERLLKRYSLRNINDKCAFEDIPNSDPYLALSYDRLHFSSGLFGSHIHPAIDAHVKTLPQSENVRKTIDNGFDAMPRWSGVKHFTAVLGQFFNDGSKHEAIAKQMIYASVHAFDLATDDIAFHLLKMLRRFNVMEMYLSFDTMTDSFADAGRRASRDFTRSIHEYLATINLQSGDIPDEDSGSESDHEEGRTGNSDLEIGQSAASSIINWNFPKAHLYLHAFDDIRNKGVTKNYNNKLNEPLHGPIRKAYHTKTNFKPGFEKIILGVEHKAYCMAQLRNMIDDYISRQEQSDENCPVHDVETGEGRDMESHTKETQVIGWHVYLGSRQNPVTFAALEAQMATFRAFKSFRTRLVTFLNGIIPHYPDLAFPNGQQVKFSPNDELTEYRYLTVYYQDQVSWQPTCDYLRSSPSFFGKERHDCVLLDPGFGKRPKFARLLFVFRCQIANQNYRLALVLPLDARPGVLRRREKELGLIRLVAQPPENTEFCFVENIIRGARLPLDHKRVEASMVETLFIDDLVDGDFFLRMNMLYGEDRP